MNFPSWVDRFTFGIIARFNEIMGCRQSMLEAAHKGLVDSGIPLIAEVGTNQFAPVGFSDDIGIYYWLPQIAHWFNLDIPQAYNCLSVFLLFMGCGVGSLGIFLCFERLVPRLIGLGALFLFFRLPVQIALNYAVSMISILSFVPLLLFFVKRPTKHTIWFVLFLFFSGVVMGYFHYIRSLSPLSTIAIMLTMIILSPSIPKIKKLQLTFVLVLGLSLPVLHFGHLQHVANNYLRHQKVQIDSNNNFGGHPFWHSAYTGLGYYPNPYGINGYSDTNSANAVKQVDPDAPYLSRQYNEILKNLYIGMVKQDPIFYVKQLFLKILETFNVCANYMAGYKWVIFGMKASILICVGTLLFICTTKKQQQQAKLSYVTNLNIAFTLAISLSLLPGMLTVPRIHYVTDFIILCYLYAAFGFVAIWQLGFSFVRNSSIIKEKIEARE